VARLRGYFNVDEPELLGELSRLFVGHLSLCGHVGLVANEYDDEVAGGGGHGFLDEAVDGVEALAACNVEGEEGPDGAG